jgi:carboxyl-terminal processing protease
MLASFLRGFALAIMFVLFIGGTFAAGFAVQQTLAPATATPVAFATPSAAATTVSQSTTESDFAVFWEVWNIVKAEFMGKVPDDQAMTYAAIKGVVDTLGDQHTHFDEPARAAILESDLNGSFEGIGATVELKNGQIAIASPLKGRPAEKAGILAGDVIVKIDGVSTDGMSLTDAIGHIRGPKGTQVTLTVVRVGAAAPLDIAVTRDTIAVEVVTKRMLDNNVAYLQLSEFSAPSSQAVDQALQELFKSNPIGLVFDLRGNPGGFLRNAIEVGSEFIDNGLILSEQSKDGSKTPHPALTGGRATKIPIVVLVDKGTASASEIIAGAIRDNKRGILVGEKTFGKGSVQVSDVLSDKSHLTITIRHWLTPNGTDIHGVGLEPDFTVPFSEADRKGGRDPQLDRAVQYLLTGK